MQAWCECGHGACGIGVEALPDDLPVPDFALRLRCSVCGSKAVKTRTGPSTGPPAWAPA